MHARTHTNQAHELELAQKECCKGGVVGVAGEDGVDNVIQGVSIPTAVLRMHPEMEPLS